MKKIILFLFMFISFINISFAENLKVGTIEREPFVIQTSDGLSGFSIELWEAISQKLGREYDLKEYKSFGKMLLDVENKKTDLAIANISITSDRERVIDFSQPIFDSGIAMMVKSPKQITILDYAKTTNYIPIFAILMLLIVITHVIHKKIDKKSVKKKHYHIILYSVSILFATMFVSSYSLEKLNTHSHSNSHISLESLKYKKIGVTAGSTSNQLLEKNKIRNIKYNNIDKMFNSLKNSEIDMIIHDKPVLDYFIKNNSGYNIVGDLLQFESFGIAFQENSELKESIDSIILELKSNGEYEEIYNKYF